MTIATDNVNGITAACACCCSAPTTRRACAPLVRGWEKSSDHAPVWIALDD